MIVNKTSLEALFNGLKTIFNGTLRSASTDWQMTAMEVPSSGAGEDYAWLTRFPKMRKWVGDKHIKSLEAGKYYRRNDDFEATIAVDRNDLEDDRLGLYNAQTKMAAESAGELPQTIIDDLKNAAFTATCMDGLPFYSTSHPMGTVTFSNKGTAVLSAVDLDAVKASYGAARAAIMSYTDEDGLPLRLIPDLLEVPPALEAVAKIICTAPKLQDDSPNPYQGTARVVVNPALASSTVWLLHVTNKESVKPFIYQNRKSAVFVAQTDTSSDNVFTRREFRFGAEARATGVYGFWQLSFGSTGAG